MCDGDSGSSGLAPALGDIDAIDEKRFLQTRLSLADVLRVYNFGGVFAVAIVYFSDRQTPEFQF